jgi:hypothetical protein
MNFCHPSFTRTFTLEFQWIMQLKIKVFCMFGRVPSACFVVPPRRCGQAVRSFFMVLPWPAKS